MNHSNLHKILKKRCGTAWTCSFKADDLNIDESVDLSIPALLPPKTIQAILDRSEVNKTYKHGKTKNSYLLSRMIFCADCGYALFGQTNKGGRRYYRHAHAKRERPCLKQKSWVGAEDIEDAVMRHLFDLFGNPKKIPVGDRSTAPGRYPDTPQLKRPGRSPPRPARVGRDGRFRQLLLRLS